MQVLAPVALVAGLLVAPELRAAGNLRIGTYNTHFIVDPLGLSDWATEGEKETAATEIAARINASDYDVLALNEVFDEDARAIIHQQTRAKYPYQVVKLFSFNNLIEDSGLMLLSRHPFVANPVQNEPTIIDQSRGRVLAWIPTGDIYRNGSTSNLGTYVRFARFGNVCQGILDDCAAEKGVGIVAIDVTMGSTVRRTAFLFTHLEANDRGIRTRQFEILQSVFGAMDYHNRFTKDDVFIMGDLNVRGDDVGLDSEWSERFAGSTTSGVASWFANGGTAFRDSWYNEGFNSYDKGYTHTTKRSRQRIDYILRNTGAKVRSSNLCDQHMSRAYNLQFGPGTINETPRSVPQRLHPDADPRRPGGRVPVQRSPRPQHGARSADRSLLAGDVEPGGRALR